MGVFSTHCYSEGRRPPEKKDKEMLTSQKALLPVKNKVNVRCIMRNKGTCVRPCPVRFMLRMWWGRSVVRVIWHLGLLTGLFFQAGIWPAPTAAPQLSPCAFRMLMTKVLGWPVWEVKWFSLFLVVSTILPRPEWKKVVKGFDLEKGDTHNIGWVSLLHPPTSSLSQDFWVLMFGVREGGSLWIPSLNRNIKIILPITDALKNKHMVLYKSNIIFSNIK